MPAGSQSKLSLEEDNIQILGNFYNTIALLNHISKTDTQKTRIRNRIEIKIVVISDVKLSKGIFFNYLLIYQY